MRAWLKRKYKQTRAWFIALLISIGVIVPAVQAVETTFTYTRATQYSDGTPMPESEIAETRLYCDGSLVATELGADQDFNPDLTPGSYDCYATHYDTYGRESVPSNTVTKVVLPGLPGAPVLDE